MLATSELFCSDDLPHELRPLLAAHHPWEILTALDSFVAEQGDDRLGVIHPTAVVEGPVFLAEGAVIGPHALVSGPSWIGPGAEVGHGACLRGGVVLAAGAFVGHASEIKRSLLLPEARAPHFNYVGDSVLGRGVNLGAGVKLANFNTFANPVRLGVAALRKFGAALGDEVSIGCNAVLAPGTIVGPRTVIYPGAMVRGQIGADRVVKCKPGLELVPRRPPT